MKGDDRSSPRPTGIRGCAVALSCLLLMSCAHGVHLHNEADAERARKALETYETVDLGSITRVGIENVTALNEAEAETQARLTQLGFQIELTDLIASNPEVSDKNGKLAQGWPRLVEETEDVLKALGSSIDPRKHH